MNRILLYFHYSSTPPGADVSLSDENGNTALHIAASIPNNDIVYLLGDYGADPTCQNKVSFKLLSYF